MTLDDKIATNLFYEYGNRIGALTGYRNSTKTSRALSRNIIAYGLMCIEIGRSLEQDALNEYLIRRDHKSEQSELTRCVLQASEDEHGIEQHLAS